MSVLPSVALVTPSLDQGRFLGAAIDSVLAQGYPRLDYLVVDGGSQDDTLELLRSYGDRIRWTSEQDGGQAEAIADGFRRTEGAILGWLNADDLLLPGALDTVARAFRDAPEAGLVYGRGEILDTDGVVTGPFGGWEPFDPWRLVHWLDYVLQPAAFFRRSAYEAVGGLDVGLHWTMDWDLWIRLAATAPVLALDRPLAGSREHGATKTSTGRWARLREIRRVARRHAGRQWTPGVLMYALDTWQRGWDRWPRPLPGLVERLVHRVMTRVTRRCPVQPDRWLLRRSELLLPRTWGTARACFEVHRMPSAGPLVLTVAVDDQPPVELRCSEPGTYPLVLEVPSGSTPFARARVRSSFSFRAPPDPRRLAVRLASLEPSPPVPPFWKGG